jgi:hypothetical protein
MGSRPAGGRAPSRSDHAAGGLLDHLQRQQPFAQVVQRLGDDEVHALVHSHDLLGIDLAHLWRWPFVVVIIDPGVADIARYQGIPLGGDFPGQPHRLAVERFQVAFAAHRLELLAVAIVGQGDHHFGAGAQELAVQLPERIGIIQHDFGDERAFDVAAPLELENVAFSAEYDALG